MSRMSSTCWLSGLGLLLLVIASASGERESQSQRLLRMAYEIETDPRLRAEWERRVQRMEYDTLPDVQFNCNVERSSAKPTNVHMLRPADIDVIGAFGDSVTAGNGLGADNAAGVALENRGESFSVGGDEVLDHGTVTLANIFKKFNPDLKGFSSCQGTTANVKRSWLNVAEPGDTSLDMASQARFMINRIKEDSIIDFFGDWKMLTLFIGGNDLCASCYDWTNFNPVAYGRQVRAAVEILFNELPRVFLNLVPMFDVSPLNELSQNIICDTLQTRFCECAINATTVGDLRATQLAYYDELKAVAEDDHFKFREDFAVVLQPHLRDFEPPRDENGDFIMDFLAPDCFHPSRLGHQSLAFWLWNTLLTPVGAKPVNSLVDLVGPNVLQCPSAIQPYLFTNFNSPRK
jgi:phospholipase B1